MGNRRVLVVEDYPDARELLVEWLEGLGYEPIPARDGVEALGILSRGTAPALMLLDLRMPVMDGWTFMAIAKERKLLAHTEVWVTSAADGGYPPLGAHGVLPKPLDLEALARIVARVCGPAWPTADSS
jgi:two-component system, response regulator, stage 0 sporulation protein F